jgi:HEAT repeat protein
MSLFGPPNIEKLKANRNFDGLGKALLKYQKSRDVRQAAAAALGELRDARGVGWLCEALKANADPDVGKAVARALSRIGGETAFSPLIGLLASNETWEAAAGALAEIGEPALAVLIPKLVEAVRLRLGEAQTLEQLKDLSPLIGRLRGSSEAESSRIWKDLKTRIGDGAAFEQIQGMTILYQRALDGRIATEATIDHGLAVLRRIGSLEALRFLFEFINLKLDDASISSSISKTALAELDKLEGQWPTPLLGEALSAPDVRLRLRAATRLSQKEEPSAKLALVKALGDADSEVRLAAIRAVGTWKYALAFQPLVRILQNTEETFGIREAAVKALAMMRDPQAVPLLIDVLRSTKDDYKSFDFRKTIISALGEFGDPRAIQPLRAAFRSEGNARKQDAIVEALGNIKDSQVIEPLIEALFSPFGDIAQKALSALKPYGPSAIPALLGKLELGRSMIAEALDQAGWTPADDRVGAIFWINRKNWEKCEAVGAPAVSPLLDRLSQKSDLQPVMTTLGRLGDVRAIEPIIQMLGHEERRLRQTAAGVLVEFYRRDKIDAAQKQLILANRDRIMAKHVDSSGHDDYGGKNYSDCPSDHHVDRKTHEDAGIGRAFDI